jgi:multiple sugar transport system substrate-binding protein
MNTRISRIIVLITLLAIALAACAPAATPATQAPAPVQPTSAPAQPAAQPTAAPAQPTTAPAQPAAPSVSELKILWAQWDPADYLQQMGNLYEKETGVKVTIVQEPWGTFGDRFATAMAAKGTEWDMVVGDSQWLGQGATAGWYVDMTDFLNSTGLKDSVTEATMKYYGEYPAGSGTYWAFPTEGDADGWAYRKDLLEDPKEKEAFKAKYGYDLTVPPKSYKELMDIAKFFTREDQGIYGVAIYTQKDYDAMTMGVENTMFPWGGSWQNDKNEVIGIVNSQQNIEAVQYYKDLYDCCQVPGLSNAFFTETNDAFLAGKAAMAMNYFAFLPALSNPKTSKYADVTGFFANPAGPNGDKGAALGGQGMSVISYVSPERQQASLDFIKWFGTEANQTKWAELGGYTCNKKVLSSDAFLKTQPYNPAFAETMTFVKDFWNIPIYAQLLQVTQTNLHNFIVNGQGTAKETMDKIAEEQNKILVENGYIK